MTSAKNEADTPRLYLVTPPLTGEETTDAPFAAALAEALAAGPVAAVRLTMAGEAEDALRRAADRLRELCHAQDVALVLTDHYRMVQALGLDGVHLANPRLSVREARKTLGPDAIVGAFAGASRHTGMTLAEAGADYVSLGPVAPGALGADEVADVDLFAWWAEMIETPVVAEGGVTPETAAMLAPHTDFIAADATVWDASSGPAAGVEALLAALG